MQEQTVGSIQQLYRYPVKSMQGEAYDRIEIDTSGVIGDRAIALIDQQTGKLVTAKQPALWKKVLSLRASLKPDGTTAVIMPSGEQWVMQDDKTPQALSDYLGRPVVIAFSRTHEVEMERADPNEVIAKGTSDLVAFETMPVAQGAPESAFVDYGPIHLIATSSLNEVGNYAQAGLSEPERFRPNLIIDTTGLPPYCENHWIGSTLCIGDQLELKITLPTPRCAVPTLEQGSIKPDKTILAPLIKDNIQPFLEGRRLPSLGVYADVITSGVISYGDKVRLRNNER